MTTLHERVVNAHKKYCTGTDNTVTSAPVSSPEGVLFNGAASSVSKAPAIS